MGCYLVTGGAGFIGSHLVDRLLATGHQVRVLDNLSTGRIENLPTEAQLVVADVRSKAAIVDALDGVDGVFHLAAVASVMRCNEAWRDCHEINLGATVTLLDACRDREPTLPFVYASSAAVYGDQEITPLHERLTPAPLGPYGADKAACELQARAAANVHGMRTFGLRFFNVFGPRQAPDDAYAGVITIFQGRARSGLPMRVHGDGLQSRDFVYVGDVVECLLRAMNSLEAAERRLRRSRQRGHGTGDHHPRTRRGDRRAVGYAAIRRTRAGTAGRDPPFPGLGRASAAVARLSPELLPKRGLEALP